MSEKLSKLKEQGTKLTAAGLIALGAFGLASCSGEVQSKPAENVVEEEVVEDTSNEEEEYEFVVTKDMLTKIPMTREWNVSEDLKNKLINLYEFRTDMDKENPDDKKILDEMKLEACKGLYSLEGFASSYAPPSKDDLDELVHARFEERLQAMITMKSDLLRFREVGPLDESMDYAVFGAEVCVFGGGYESPEAYKSATEFYTHVKDIPAKKVTTEVFKAPPADSLDFKRDLRRQFGQRDPKTGELINGDEPGRWVGVTVTVEGEEPKDLYRGWTWNATLNDWEFFKEQTEDPTDPKSKGFGFEDNWYGASTD